PVSRAAGEIDQINVCVTTLVTGVSDAIAIRTQRRMHADGVVMSQLPDVASIAIGDINLFLSAAAGDERNFRSGDSFLPGQRFNNVVRELVGAIANISAVALGKHSAAAVIDHLPL